MRRHNTKGFQLLPALLWSVSAGAEGLDGIPAPAGAARIYERISERDDYTLITGPIEVWTSSKAGRSWKAG